MRSASSGMLPGAAWLAGAVFGAAVLAATPARAEVLLLPFERFRCEAGECPLDFADSSGADAAAAGDTAESRSRAGALGQTRRGEATVGMRFRVCEPTEARIVIRGLYFGRLKGAWGGFVNRAWLEIRAVLLDLTTGETVDQVTIRREEERGEFGKIVTSPVTNFLPIAGADITGAVVNAPLEANHLYVAAFRLVTGASGAAPRAISDVKTDDLESRLSSIEIELTPDLPDGDGDGLFDVWETEGLKDCDGNVLVDLPGMGADPDHKDVFVEYDWLPGSEPTRAAIDFVKSRFAAAPGDSGVDGIANPDGEDGITLWIDTGELRENGILVGDNLGGGGEVALADVPNGRDVPRVSGDSDGDGVADFREVKDLYFDRARRAVFHYGLSGPKGRGEIGPPLPGGEPVCEDGADNDGDGLVDRDDVLDCFRGGQAAGGANFFVSNADASTFMHELGHSLGLGHGGIDSINCKPNYLSIMNYVYSGGVPRDDDGDGVFESRTEDFSGLPLPSGGRATAPLPTLVESDLDEEQVLDSGDGVHALRFVDGTGTGRESAVDSPNDWNGQNGIESGDIDPVDINAGDETGSPAACAEASAAAEEPATDTLQGADDWHALVFRFTPDSVVPGASMVDVIEEERPDPATVDAVFGATDLAIAKSVDPDPWVGGQTVTYRLAVENKGPNGAAFLEVVDRPSAGVRFVDPPENCNTNEQGALHCPLDPLPVGASTTLELQARLPLATSCGGDQFLTVVNDAEVVNLRGRERRVLDNRVTAEHRILCPIYEYPAKFVCGTQPEAADRSLLRGAYGTTVNLHNPSDEEVFVFAKLALARQAEPLAPGPVLPIDLFSFEYDEAVSIDCDVVGDRLFPDGFPDELIDGFLVIQSARRLDVTGVYTTALLDEAGRPAGHSSVDVEPINERERRPPRPRPDLLPDILGADLNCDQGNCRLDMGYQLENIGEGDAGAFVARLVNANGGVTLTTESWGSGLAAGAVEIRTFSVALSSSDLGSDISFCVEADRPADAVEETDETNNVACQRF